MVPQEQYSKELVEGQTTKSVREVWTIKYKEQISKDYGSEERIDTKEPLWKLPCFT